MWMLKVPPVAVVLAGINGAGKTTSAKKLLANRLALLSFVNSDVIAKGINGCDPESVAMEAGTIMIDRMHKLADQKENFSVETTLVGRVYISFLRKLHGEGYRVEISYFLASDAAPPVRRVRDRLASGEHNIPEATIRKRYGRSMKNSWNEYRPLADFGAVYNNDGSEPRLILAVWLDQSPFVSDESDWKIFQGVNGHE